MEKRRRRCRRCRGATLFEAVLALCVMFLIFFALLQVYHWAMTQVFCQYGAFYGAKGAGLGYRTNIALRGVRVGAIPVSGKGYYSYDNEEIAASRYMTRGDASGVRYAYWHPQSDSDPWLDIGGSRFDSETVECYARLRNLPLLTDSLSKILLIGTNPEPGTVVENYNFSRIFMEGD